MKVRVKSIPTAQQIRWAFAAEARGELKPGTARSWVQRARQVGADIGQASMEFSELQSRMENSLSALEIILKDWQALLDVYLVAGVAVPEDVKRDLPKAAFEYGKWLNAISGVKSGKYQALWNEETKDWDIVSQSPVKIQGLGIGPGVVVIVVAGVFLAWQAIELARDILKRAGVEKTQNLISDIKDMPKDAQARILNSAEFKGAVQRAGVGDSFLEGLKGLVGSSTDLLKWAALVALGYIIVREWRHA